MSSRLQFLAGAKAYAHIKDGGLQAADIAMMAGAAGGPKWIVLHGMDRFLLDHWFAGRTRPLHLLGSSIGNWRFAACLSRATAGEGLDVFKELYFSQVYGPKPSATEISSTARALLADLLNPTTIPNVLSHPFGRLQMIAVRAKGLVGASDGRSQRRGLLLAMLANAISRSNLAWFFDRVVIRDPRDTQALFAEAPFHTQYFDLTEKNIGDALMASSAIPVVMEGVTAIDGLPAGMYRDGGITDYHMALPYQVAEDKVVLLPHFFDNVKPGWFDKHLPYRKANPADMENVLVVCPSPSFIASLPGAKVPDRKDFDALETRERLKRWEEAYAKSAVLGEELQEVLESGKIREDVKKHF
jgi:hypothetical protein